MKIVLGKPVTDYVSGFTGIAIALCTYLHGADRVLVQPNMQDTKGSFVEPQWFDVGMLVAA